MLGYNISLTLESLRTILRVAIDIIIIWFLVYYALKVVRTNSRTSQIFKGIIVVVLVNALSKFFGLTTVTWLSDMFISWGFLAIIIVFQPEIRTLLERLGKSNVFSRMGSLSGNEKNQVVDVLVQVTGLLSQNQVGALITLEQSQSLYEYIEKATPINGSITPELLTSIFVTSTPLHDGAVIIEGNKIACAGAYFPSSNADLPNRFGARHRAAIGISEVSDAVSIVVSEETGAISITEGGRIFGVNKAQLRDYLMRVICGEETQASLMVSPTNEPSEEQPTTTAEQTEPKGRVFGRLAVRKHDTTKKKKKTKKSKTTPSQQPENTAPNIERDMKLPHHKVEQIKGYETISTHHDAIKTNVERVSETKSTPVNKSVETKSSTPRSTGKTTMTYSTNLNVSPMGVKSVETPGTTSVNPIIDNESKAQTKPVEPSTPNDSPAQSQQKKQDDQRIEQLLERTASIDISALMGDSSISSQMDVLRNTSLSDSKGKKER